MHLVVFCTKGLEYISTEELEKLSGITNLICHEHELTCEYQGDVALLTKLKTVNDVCVVLQEVSLKDDRSVQPFLDAIPNLAEKIYTDILAPFRSVKKNFSLAISTLHAEKGVADKLEQQIKAILCSAGWEFVPDYRGEITFRLDIKADVLRLVARITEKPLHHRTYNHEWMGALRPTIAAAMLFKVSKWKEKGVLLDPFCGSGTFLCEGLALGLDVYGSDKDLDAVNMAKANYCLFSSGERAEEHVVVADAKKLPWSDKKFDFLITNLPWGKQVRIDSHVDLYSGFAKEMGRVMKTDCVMAIVCQKGDLLVKYLKMYFPKHSFTREQIGYLGQRPEIVWGKIAN